MKSISLILILAVAALTFTGCVSRDENTREDLVGYILGLEK